MEDELPEVLELLKIARTFIRQLKIFKKSGIPVAQRELIKEVLEKVRFAIDEYLEGEQ